MILSKKQMNHYTSEGYKMKKHNRLKKIIEKIAIRAAISEANTTCPLYLKVQKPYKIRWL